MIKFKQLKFTEIDPRDERFTDEGAIPLPGYGSLYNEVKRAKDRLTPGVLNTYSKIMNVTPRAIGKTVIDAPISSTMLVAPIPATTAAGVALMPFESKILPKPKTIIKGTIKKAVDKSEKLKNLSKVRIWDVLRSLSYVPAALTASPPIPDWAWYKYSPEVAQAKARELEKEFSISKDVIKEKDIKNYPGVELKPIADPNSNLGIEIHKRILTPIKNWVGKKLDRYMDLDPKSGDFQLAEDIKTVYPNLPGKIISKYVRSRKTPVTDFVTSQPLVAGGIPAANVKIGPVAPWSLITTAATAIGDEGINAVGRRISKDENWDITDKKLKGIRKIKRGISREILSPLAASLHLKGAQQYWDDVAQGRRKSTTLQDLVETGNPESKRRKIIRKVGNFLGQVISNGYFPNEGDYFVGMMDKINDPKEIKKIHKEANRIRNRKNKEERKRKKELMKQINEEQERQLQAQLAKYEEK